MDNFTRVFNLKCVTVMPKPKHQRITEIQKEFHDDSFKVKFGAIANGAVFQDDSKLLSLDTKYKHCPDILQK